MGTDKKTKESNEGPGALDNATFEEAAAELQTIVDKLNSGSAQLDEMIALYERGVALRRPGRQSDGPFAMDTKEYLLKYGAAVNSALETAMFLPGVPDTLARAMRYSVEAGGKRVRPCLVLGTAEMLGGSREMALDLGCGLEMIHTYSLIHDDLPPIDNDDLRRGRPSNHKVFGEGQAIFAGDALLTYAFEWMLSKGIYYNNSNYYKAVLEIAKRAGAGGMVAGQSLDLEAEQRGSLDEAELYRIHERKTADMLTAAVLSGALCGSPTQAQLDALCEYS